MPTVKATSQCHMAALFLNAHYSHILCVLSNTVEQRKAQHVLCIKALLARKGQEGF